MHTNYYWDTITSNFFRTAIKVTMVKCPKRHTLNLWYTYGTHLWPQIWGNKLADKYVHVYIFWKLRSYRTRKKYFRSDLRRLIFYLFCNVVLKLARTELKSEQNISNRLKRKFKLKLTKQLRSMVIASTGEIGK